VPPHFFPLSCIVPFPFLPQESTLRERRFYLSLLEQACLSVVASTLRSLSKEDLTSSWSGGERMMRKRYSLLLPSPLPPSLKTGRRMAGSLARKSTFPERPGCLIVVVFSQALRHE